MRTLLNVTNPNAGKLVPIDPNNTPFFKSLAEWFEEVVSVDET